MPSRNVPMFYYKPILMEGYRYKAFLKMRLHVKNSRYLSITKVAFKNHSHHLAQDVGII